MSANLADALAAALRVTFPPFLPLYAVMDHGAVAARLLAHPDVRSALAEPDVPAPHPSVAVRAAFAFGWWPIRYYVCAHSTAGHATESDCDVYREREAAERRRMETYGPCPSCEYGLPMGCNHPLREGSPR